MRFNSFLSNSIATAGLVCAFSFAAAAQNQTQNPRQQPQPAQPGALPPATTQLPPNSSTAPIRPGNEAQQSTQPQPGVQQERQQTAPNTNSPRPQTPQITTPGQNNPPGATTQIATPAGTAAPTSGATTTTTTGTGTAPVNGVPAAPGQNVGGQSIISPSELPTEPPPVAPNFEAPARPLPSAERVGVDIMNQLPLTLDEAIRLALENNNDIDSARVQVQIAEFGLRGARGVYDPIISNESYYESRTTPTSSVIGGAGATGAVRQTDFTTAPRFGGFTPFAGGAYQADFNLTRLTTNNQNVLLNPQFPAAFSFTYTQPLWRGLRFDLNRRNIEIAKKNLSLTDAQFRQRAIEVIAGVEAAYWDLAFALRNLQVQIDAVRQARTQLESNQRLVAKGALAPIEIVAATTQITTFEQNVYTAQESVTRAENALKTLMLKERTNEIWSRPITPVTPVSLEPPSVDLSFAVTDALKNRPEIAQLETNLEINRVDQRFLRDQTKPQIDLIGTYTAAGLAGIQTPPRTATTVGTTAQIIQRVNELSAAANLPPLNVTTTNNAPPANLVGGYLNSLGNLVQNDFPTYRVGVRVSLPLRNSTAQANLGSSLAAGTQLQNQRRQLEQVIESDVRNAVQALRSSEARLQSAAAARAATEQQYESEQRQFRAGATTVFLVLQRQNELLAARGRELQAQTDLNKAISELNRATGSTLSANNVSINGDAAVPQFVFRPVVPVTAFAPNVRRGGKETN